MSGTIYEPPGTFSTDRAMLGLGTIPRTLLPSETAVVRRAWRGAYVRRLVAGDVACALVAMAAGLATQSALPPTVVLLALPLVWLVALAVAGSYDRNVLCDGFDEFRRVFAAAGLVLAGVGLYSWFFGQEVSHGLVALMLPAAAALTLAGRSAQRQFLWRARAKGRDTQRTLLVGPVAAVAALHTQLGRQAGLGYRVVGCCLSTPPNGTRPGLPVLGDVSDVPDVVHRFAIDTVAALPSTELDGAALRRLGWELEKTPADLMLVPSVTDMPGVPGPRLQMQPLDGLPLLHVARPRLRGVRRAVKTVFDRTATALVLVVVAPVLLAVAVAIKADSSGPVLFREQRVGRDGRLFPMLKFRTTVSDRRHTEPDGPDGPTTARPDREVTRVGRVLRRHCLDGLPRLFNVLTGEMSLVGPRPPLPVEVDRYGLDVRNRLVVKPGLTGMWFVNNRSDLSWEDSVRVDVHHAENWSLSLDLLVLARTCAAVVRGQVTRGLEPR